MCNFNNTILYLGMQKIKQSLFSKLRFYFGKTAPCDHKSVVKLDLFFKS